MGGGISYGLASHEWHAVFCTNLSNFYIFAYLLRERSEDVGGKVQQKMGKGSRISGIFKENPNFPTKTVSFKVFLLLIQQKILLYNEYCLY